MIETQVALGMKTVYNHDVVPGDSDTDTDTADTLHRFEGVSNNRILLALCPSLSFLPVSFTIRI